MKYARNTEEENVGNNTEIGRKYHGLGNKS